MPKELREALRRRRTAEIARALGVHPSTVRRWKKRGLPKSDPALRERLRSLSLERREPRERIPKELRRALDVLGSQIRVAAALGVHPSTVRRWKKGVSKAVRERLAALVTKKREEREEKRARKKSEALVYKELLELTRERSPESVPKDRSRQGPVSGPKTRGYEWVKVWGVPIRLGNYDAISYIEEWAREARSSARVRFSHWNLSAKVSELQEEGTEDALKGYKTVVVQVKHERTGDFWIQSILATVSSRVLENVLSDLRRQFEEISESGVYFVVHSTRLKNYSIRTDAERRAYNSAKARERKRKKRKR